MLGTEGRLTSKLRRNFIGCPPQEQEKRKDTTSKPRKTYPAHERKGLEPKSGHSSTATAVSSWPIEMEVPKHTKYNFLT
jgi:hypothetical protein